MRIYHDWEFLETSNSVMPISVGMVAEDGRELYYEFADAPWKEIENHSWLMENVMPHLNLTEYTYLPRNVIMNKVYNFLLEVYADSGNLELWGWYSAYDHVCLGQLFGRMVNLPHFVPGWTNDIRQEVHRLGNPKVPDLRVPNEMTHHALDDARVEMRMHNWLRGYEASRQPKYHGVQFGSGNTQTNVF